MLRGRGEVVLAPPPKLRPGWEKKISLQQDIVTLYEVDKIFRNQFEEVKDVKLVFLLGKLASLEQQQQLQAEQLVHGDIIQNSGIFKGNSHHIPEIGWLYIILPYLFNAPGVSFQKLHESGELL